MASSATDSATEVSEATVTPPISTLIEFPGVSRNQPQWRKDLSERVREIQERRARETTREATPVRPQRAEQSTPQLGLVPQPDAPAVNPIVVAALKRIERARQSSPVQRSRGGMSSAATAVAHAVAEQYQTDERREMERAEALQSVPMSQANPETLSQVTPTETVREHSLVVVPSPGANRAAVTAQAQPAQVRAEVMKNESLNQMAEATVDAASLEELYDDRAPITSRLAGGMIDLLVVAFAASPFAAIIELTDGDWSDLRVVASMCGIVVTVMFLYHVASTALVGRTWGMSLFSIRAVDAETGLSPTTKQAVRRCLVYMISLATFGLGILYAIFDAEGRAAHDLLSGTAVIRE